MTKTIINPEDGIKAYLNGMIKMREQFNMHMKEHQFASFEELILGKGRQMHNPKFIKGGAMKECFKNSYNLMQKKGYTYCEGYAMGIIPVLHAWCLDKKGNVVDPTWKDGTEYYGIPFKTEYVLETAIKREYYGIIDNWQDRWPLLVKFNDEVVQK